MDGAQRRTAASTPRACPHLFCCLLLAPSRTSMPFELVGWPENPCYWPGRPEEALTPRVCFLRGRRAPTASVGPRPGSPAASPRCAGRAQGVGGVCRPSQRSTQGCARALAPSPRPRLGRAASSFYQALPSDFGQRPPFRTFEAGRTPPLTEMPPPPPPPAHFASPHCPRPACLTCLDRALTGVPPVGTDLSGTAPCHCTR